MTYLNNLLQIESLDDFIGQEHIIGKDKALYQLIYKKELPHLFFYGTPGTGKTTLAKLIAKIQNTNFYHLNATTLKIDELREIFKKYKNSLIKPLIFIDEVHRLNKTQQEVLLPIMENYQAIIIGASTENPFFTLTNAIRSRSFLFEFKPHQDKDLNKLITKIESTLQDIKIDEQAKEYLIKSSAGDARALINLLDFAYKIDNNITISTLKQLRQTNISDSSNNKQSHYDIASAMIKSLRGSDIDASLYYLARLIDGGEDIKFITRRLVIFASEDIGNANPNALNLAVSTMLASNQIGLPESRIILAQCVVYLASSPKSNSSYKAINKALDDIKNGKILNIPQSIKQNHTNYQNPHNFSGWCDQKYLSEDLKFYHSNQIAFEKTLEQWINKIKNQGE
jgi:putative ATPase